ncbi:hypothetical protein N9J01_00245 [bacterium]|nr:hypothetical protein [bacterium]
MAISKIGSKALVDCSVAAVDIEDGSITSAKLAGSIANAKLANSSITVNGTSVSLGASGSIPAVSWQSVKTDSDSPVTLVAGNGYFMDTTSGAITATLPGSPSAGDTIAIKDYAGTFATNNLTIGRNGNNIQGVANDSLISTNRASIILVYSDATKGWLYTVESNVDFLGPLYVTATGGTVTESGDFKIHTFTGDGCFVVSCGGNTSGSETVDYLVVAGAGGGGTGGGGGAGAGGYRTTFPSPGCNAGAFPISVTTYPITVGGGGTGGSFPVNPSANTSGSNSVFSTITSAGGGKGGNDGASDAGTGGSGGGGGQVASSGAAGNTPPVSPPQGNPGGDAITGYLDNRPNGGGGGAGGAGTTGIPTISGSGGNGLYNLITGSSVGYAGGGGSGTGSLANFAGSTNPDFGGGAGGKGTASGISGTANRGSGGGGGGGSGGGTGGAGGSGIVIIRYKFQ